MGEGAGVLLLEELEHAKVAFVQILLFSWLIHSDFVQILRRAIWIYIIYSKEVHKYMLSF